MTRDPADVAFGEHVRTRRVSLRLSQELLAERSGVSLEHLGRVERADKCPSLRIARRIAAGLGVPLADLVTG